ncbi:MAG TPA: pyrroloquinoline quinone biosynthesis protein PqqE [Bosea sp. (in: a-proteobacteria)]|jgi:pyrroloquinoline quinone biosynthesis protein E|uniref:pyrroloquinoline quinone biosynthesis protein PqqE n=1 Tax=Bosea sp. (in: a-proteobacteria) TaxID=1871050 RepID=UPI002E0E8C78|nr:pyrroloquinoline quinone biosynthesis protein PqqE [Bosea sp. (in: a-proteobacteria)]
MGLLAELTHRCALRCPYCSNPLELERRSSELPTSEWKRLIDEAAALGVLHIYFSGGEPMLRRDIAELVAHSHGAGLYTNMITSGVGFQPALLDAVAEAGLDHIQLSVQAIDATTCDRVAGYEGASERKHAVAADIARLGLRLTVNAVIHRENVHEISDFVRLAEAWGAARIEIAHVQYYGWGLVNRARLMPTRQQVETAMADVEEARSRTAGRLVIDCVLPDYYARYPKACMGGWGARLMNVTPSGRALPCHAAETITGMTFDHVRNASLSEIWYRGAAFNAFRGTDWMKEPCRSCARKELDFGGCRCQAMALAGDAAATDPACSLSPLHAELVRLAEAEAGSERRDFIYRSYQGA